jgi:RNA polymerase sigma-70 factor (ECF subfamily)
MVVEDPRARHGLVFMKREDAFAIGRARLPGVALAAERFLAYLSERLDDATLSEDIAHDLYLACACLEGDARALEELEKSHLSLVPQFVAGIDSTESGVDEIRQELRDRLLVGRGESRPKLAEYRGRGRLASWLRVVALRTALNMRAGAKQRVSPEAADALLASPDPELEYLRARYAPQFHAAFEQALATLDAQERTVLRMHLVDGLSIDRIGQLFDVHRATAARWLGRAREQLFVKTRDYLHAELGLSATEFASIVKLVQSQLDVSICRMLDGS